MKPLATSELSMTSPAPAAYPRGGRAWWFIAILFVASIVSVIDRSILNIVVDPVKADIGLSDVQVSLLQGLAFGVFYAAVGLPLGLSADRYSRRWLIIAGMGLWSLATAAAGFTHDFGGMFATRLLVGLGEAALSPAALSLIADLFPPDKRGRPISVFLMGQAIASGLSISLAGFILHAVQAGHLLALPIVGGLAGWRVVFIACGLGGLLVVALMLTTREPPRRSARETGNFGQQAAQCAGYMTRNRAIFIPFYLAFACCFAAAYGAAAWTPSMLLRQFGATPGQLGQFLGPLSLVFGVLGPLVGGLLADRQARRKAYASRLKLLSLAPLFGIPAVTAVFSPVLGLAIFMVSTIGAVTALIGTVTFSALQTMTPPTMRGVAVSLTGLVNTIIGATLGPLLVAEFTQHLYGDPALVGYAIATFAVPALLLGAAFFALAHAALRRQMRDGGEVARVIAG